MNRKQIIRNLKNRGITFDANASTSDLQALLVGAKNRFTKTFDYAGGRGKITVAFNSDKADDPAEILICDEIGKDPWSGEGISVKDIRATLDAITPKNRPLNFLVNSPGGSVSEGCAIRNILDSWDGEITKTIIGVAASTASWCIPADKVLAYKNSQIFLHQCWGMVVGNADDMRAAIDFLETTDGQIAQMLADQSDADADEMMDLMKAETLLTGQEAMDLGLVDEIVDGDAKNQFSTEQMNAMKSKLAALRNTISAPVQGADLTKQKTENMKQKSALLKNRGIAIPDGADEAALDSLIAASDAMRAQNKTILTAWNVTIPTDATDAAIVALVTNGKPTTTATAPTVEDLQKQVNRLTEADNAAKTLRIKTAIDKLIVDDKLTENEREVATELASAPVTGEKYLASLNSRVAKPPGAEPLGALLENSNLEIVGEALTSIQNFVLENSDKFQDKFVGANADNYLREDDYGRNRIRKEMANRAQKAARAVSGITNPKNRAKILAAWNSNSIDAGLQRQVIFTDFIEEFAVVLLPFETFSKYYQNVPLEGTDEVDVPFYPLSGATANSWSSTTGYNTIANTTLNTRPIQVGGSGTNSGSSATAGTAKDRKYVGLQFSSYELRRQPYESWEQHAKLQANALAVSITSDVISRVICAANFGVSAKATPAALFSASDIADLTEVANGANWPTFGRWLILDHRYLTPLLKDTSFKQYLAYGSTDPIRMAQIKAAYGFENILIVPNLNSYSPAGENLFGWINHVNGVLLATAPIMPTEDVLNLLTRYDLIVHPSNGITLEHRRFANLTLDQSIWTVECNYGANKGRASGLQRITSS